MAPPDRRLFSARGWNLPIPEALFVIGGLIASTIGSLCVIPSLYLVLDRLELRSTTRTA